jgi:hypothetical protein
MKGGEDLRPQELQAEVQELARLAKERVLTDGLKYYDSEKETFLFEEMDPKTLARYIDEELIDIINYTTMLRIRLRQSVENWERLNESLGG